MHSITFYLENIQWPKINPPIYGQMIFDEGAKFIQYGKEFFNSVGKKWISVSQRKRLDPDVIPQTKINSVDQRPKCQS